VFDRGYQLPGEDHLQFRSRGLLPSVTARLTERGKTPWVAFSVYLALALGLSYAFGWNTDPVPFFGEIATMGTILIALSYLIANLALPVYHHRYERKRFSALKHVVLPILGARGDRLSAV
jgi:amino acid transporter